MLDRNTLDLPESLLLLLQNAGPVTRRTALRKTSQALIRRNKARIRANQTPDGDPMPPRKKGKARMFQRIAKQMKRINRGEYEEIGFYGRTGKVAATHQYGRTVKTPHWDIPMPVRELLGVNAEDAEIAKDILLEHLLEGVQ